MISIYPIGVSDQFFIILYIKAVYASKFGTTHWEIFKNNAGKSFPEEILTKARLEIGEVCKVLEQNGITVRRPEPVDFSMEYVTPDFRSTGEQCMMLENLSKRDI